MGKTWKTFDLTETFSPIEDVSLQEFLKANAIFNVRVQFGALRRLDPMMIELLLCAAKAAQANGLAFELGNVPAEIDRVLTRLGVSEEILVRKVLV